MPDQWNFRSDGHGGWVDSPYDHERDESRTERDRGDWVWTPEDEQ